MTVDEAAHILREMYRKAPKGGKATSIHLFGIIYAKELSGLNIADIADQATGYKSYQVEINHGIRLAEYVQLKDNPE